MRQIAFTLAVVFLAVSAVTAQTQETGPAALVIPVAVPSQADCTGFIAKPSVPHDLFVVGGADDDFHSVVRQFVKGDSIFISRHRGEDLTVGAEYSVVRPANELFRTMHYQGQRSDISKSGIPYEDVGRVKVTHVGPEGAVAAVTFSCGSIVPGDTLVPFQPRAIWEYTVSKPLDHFAPLDKNKQHGRITASRNNFGNFGRETVVYLNLGEKEGAKARSAVPYLQGSSSALDGSSCQPTDAAGDRRRGCSTFRAGEIMCGDDCFKLPRDLCR